MSKKPEQRNTRTTQMGCSSLTPESMQEAIGMLREYSPVEEWEYRTRLNDYLRSIDYRRRSQEKLPTLPDL